MSGQGATRSAAVRESARHQQAVSRGGVNIDDRPARTAASSDVEQSESTQAETTYAAGTAHSLVRSRVLCNRSNAGSICTRTESVGMHHLRLTVSALPPRTHLRLRRRQRSWRVHMPDGAFYENEAKCVALTRHRSL